jgi:predicted aldo/keto reductase-like oxidoreductase
MQYRKFGKLDWPVSALGFGCMRLPVLNGNSGQIDLPEAIRMMRWAIDAGVNYMDTAYVYHDQTSETALGKALQDGYRQRVRIATKLPVWMVKESADFDRLLNEQLKRLQSETIDFYLLHALNRDSWKDVQAKNLLACAEKALADGRIRYLGFSFHDNLESFKTIVDGYDRWDFCQIQYNYMDIENQAGTEGLRYAASRGLGVVIMEPLLGGKLAAELPALAPVWDSAENKRKPADWALQWLWNQPEVSLVLSGMSTFTQVHENVTSASVSRPGVLAADELAVVDKARQVLKGLCPIPCTQCEYCLPCPNGVNIPRNFEVYNWGAMYNDYAGSKIEYRRWLADDQKAACCIQCEECLSKCPQKIEISSWLPVVEEVLGLDRPYKMSL